MGAEFTGERVIPGEVDIDLWNEHIARYAFAARLARRKRVLDAGCGTGYGSAELASVALHVTGIDVSSDAIEFASGHFDRHNLKFVEGSCTQLDFPDASFDLVVAFEVIEHLVEWRSLIQEAHRVLAPGGQFVVSTPNRSYYAESRASTGPNPFHEHEFDFDEFREALSQVFPHVALFVENHSDSIVFKPVGGGTALSADVRVDGRAEDTGAAHFFLAVCANQPQTGAPAFLYLPSGANVLREREKHIARLEAELRTKNAWLEQLQGNHHSLVTLHEETSAELNSSNRWAMGLDQKLRESGERIVRLQEELKEAAEEYESEIARIEAEIRQWRASLELEAAAARDQLVRCVELLHAAEATVEERTRWAMNLDEEIALLKRHINEIRGSRWIQFGRRIGVGPRIQGSEQ